MNKKTLNKFISMAQRELNALLLKKFNLESVIQELEVELLSMQEIFKAELEIISKVIIHGFNTSEFIKNELCKQAEKQVEINSEVEKLKILKENILCKNIDKKTYEYLMEQVINAEKLQQDKNEMQLLDDFNINNYAKPS